MSPTKLIIIIHYLIQTHISENDGEIAAVKELFPQNTNYADVYDEANLLTNKVTI
jgi:cytosine/adenosine deaminase-related metal-dependent hydrolase